MLETEKSTTFGGGIQGGLISLWLFLFPIFIFAAQPKELFLDGLKKLRVFENRVLRRILGPK
jgi:hypothetical protein